MSCATNSWLQLLNLVRLEPWKEASSRQYFTLMNLIVSIWLYTRTRNDCAIGISKLLTQNLASYFMVTLWHQFYKQFVLSIPIADQGNQKRYFKELNQNDVETILNCENILSSSNGNISPVWNHVENILIIKLIFRLKNIYYDR